MWKQSIFFYINKLKFLKFILVHRLAVNAIYIINTSQIKKSQWKTEILEILTHCETMAKNVTDIFQKQAKIKLQRKETIKKSEIVYPFIIIINITVQTVLNSTNKRLKIKPSSHRCFLKFKTLINHYSLSNLKLLRQHNLLFCYSKITGNF